MLLSYLPGLRPPIPLKAATWVEEQQRWQRKPFSQRMTNADKAKTKCQIEEPCVDNSQCGRKFQFGDLWVAMYCHQRYALFNLNPSK